MRRFGATFLLCVTPLMTEFRCSAQDKKPDQILAEAKAVYSQQGAKAAFPEYQKALAAYQQSGDKSGEAITIGLIGNCYKHLGEYPKALEMLNTSLSMKRELHERLEEGKTLSNIGLVYWEQGEYPKAIQTFKESITVGQELGNVQLQASALNNLSLVYDEQGDYRRSLEQYEKALELHRSIKFEPGESDTLGNLGGVYLSLGRFSQAESYYRQSLEISRRLGLKPSETQDLGNIANCQLGLGEIKEALQSLDQALAIAEGAGMFKEVADWHRIRASAQLRTGRYDLALKDFDTAERSYARAGLRREEAEVLMDSGMAHSSLGDKPKAEERIRKALAISREIGYKRGVLADRLDLAEVQLQAGNWTQSRRTAEAAFAEATQMDALDFQAQALLELARISLGLYQYRAAEIKSEQARERAHDGGLKLLEAEALIVSGTLDLKQGRPQDAIGKLESAKKISSDAEDVDLLWQSQFIHGRALESLHRYEEAVSEYRAAIDTIEDVRTSISERRFRTGYLQNKQKVYVALIALLMKMGKNGDAFGFSERLREYSFLQFQGDLPGTLDPRVAESKARIRHLQEMIDQENGKKESEQRSEARKTYSEELIGAQRDLRDLVDRSSRKSLPRPLDVSALQDLQRALPQRTALVEYVVDQSDLMIFVVSRSGLHALSVPVRERDLKAKVELLSDLITEPTNSAWQKPSASLRGILISPLEGRSLLAGISSLFIVPHGVLNNVPFAALSSAGSAKPRLLVEQYEIGELPSGGWLLLNPAQNSSGNPVSLLAVAPANSQLKFAIPEARQVATLFAPTSVALVGPMATETQFKAIAGNFDIIHLATHGFFNHVNPLFSGLKLEPDDANDGRLEVHEIMSLHLKARLVTLSACETALGGGDFFEIPAGDEFVGLSRAFLEAGSEAVLASLWKVDDVSTAEMMGRLYRSMKTQNGVIALASAQRDMIADPQYSHPFYWAPFVLVGGRLNQAQIVAEKR